MDECIEAMAEVLASLARDELFQPLRFVLKPPNAAGLMGFMPAHRGGERAAYSLKEIVVTPDNPTRGLDAHQGAVLLHDGKTGELTALLNASPITAIRTAAVSAVATRALARPGAQKVAIIGTGVQGRSHEQALRAVAPRRRDPLLESQQRWQRRGARARRGRRLHLHELERAGALARVAEAGRARERGRLERPVGAGARRGDDGRRLPLRRPARVDAERVGRVSSCRRGRRDRARSTSSRSSARC